MMSIAKRRWKLLGDVIKTKKLPCDPTISVRRFTSFGLLETTLIGGDSWQGKEEGEDERKEEEDFHHAWFHYTCPDFPLFDVYVRHHDGSCKLTELNGFNNTGNVCIWPSEEVLLYYCLQNAHRFRGQSVCELGGGMTCLAGLAVALCTEASDVLLTDGNNQSVENVHEIVKKNRLSFTDTNVDCRVLRWDCERHFSDLYQKFDIIICADCLFFDDCQIQLINVIERLLKPLGEAIIFAPNRGHTFEAFETIAKQRFSVIKTSMYDNKIWQLHATNTTKGLDEYDADIHYPILLQLSAKSP